MPSNLHEQRTEEDCQLLLDDEATLVGVALVAVFTPLQVLEILGLWPFSPLPELVFSVLGVLLVLLAQLGRSRVLARQAKLEQLH